MCNKLEVKEGGRGDVRGIKERGEGGEVEDIFGHIYIYI